MERMTGFVREAINLFSGEPWYVKTQAIFGALAMVVLVIFILAYCAEITKTLFTVDFAAICYFIYVCFQESVSDAGGIGLGAALCAILAVLFFFLIVSDEEGMGMIELFFSSLADGAINVGIIMMMATIVLIPLGSSCWRKNDRY